MEPEGHVDGHRGRVGNLGRRRRGLEQLGRGLAGNGLVAGGAGGGALDAAQGVVTDDLERLRDVKGERTTREAAMAKMVSTEEAQKTIDRALQMFGGLGVTRGETVERLYREIRALRIYEGATEVQKLIIARETLKGISG